MGMVKAPIAICCVCDKVSVDRRSSERPTPDGFEQWMSLRSFLHFYRLGKDDYKLIDTYCPQCMDQLAKTGMGSR